MLRGVLSLLMLAHLDSPVAGGLMAEQIAQFNAAELLSLAPIPQLQENYLAPDTQAKAAILVDDQTGIILYEKNADTPLPMASLTKIMVAIIILENHALDETVEIPSNYAGLEGVKIGLHKGESMSVYNLLQALLIRSAGDAAMSLAEYHSGSVEAFVEVMNQRAKTLNLTQTHFENPVGLDGDQHYSSARDLSIMARYAMRFSTFEQIVQKSSASIQSADGSFSYQFNSTNYLLGSYLNILGVKTGTTDGAGQSLINMAQNEQGNRILSVLLNSPDRFQESKSMIDWGFRSHLW